MRDLITALMVLVLAVAGGIAGGWHWRGAAFEREAALLRAEIVAREEAKRADIERQLAHAREQTARAERVAVEADKAKAETIETLAQSAATEVEIVNGQIAEVFR